MDLPFWNEVFAIVSRSVFSVHTVDSEQATESNVSEMETSEVAIISTDT